MLNSNFLPIDILSFLKISPSFTYNIHHTVEGINYVFHFEFDITKKKWLLQISQKLYGENNAQIIISRNYFELDKINSQLTHISNILTKGE